MYKLLMVDDEPIVCNGLKKFVDWEALGFEIVGIANSVAQALVILEQEAVDVVLTDIRMPIQNGLVLLEIIKEEYSDIKVVILSGYGEFEYARVALRLGAVEFITKPVDFQELKNIFKTLYDDLKNEKLKKLADEEYVSLKQEMVLNYLAKGYEFSIDGEELDMLKVYVLKKPFIVMRIVVDSKNISYEIIKERKDIWRQSFDAWVGEYKVFNVFYNEPKELCYIIYLESGETEEAVDTLLQKWENDNKELLDIGVVIGVSTICGGIEDMSRAYLEAAKAIHYHAIKNRNYYVKYSEINNILYHNKLTMEDIKLEIIGKLLEENEENLIKYIDELLTNAYYGYRYSTNILYSFCMEILLILDNYQSQYTEEDNKELLYDTIRATLIKDTFGEIKEEIFKYIKKVTPSLKEFRNIYPGNVVESAKQYIKEHYAEEVTLNILAQMLYIHPVYLSRLFKEKTGENFIDYLTNIRIERAKYFLGDSSLKIYDVCELVGYQSSKYFSKIFKNIVGKTPKEYKENRLE